MKKLKKISIIKSPYVKPLYDDDTDDDNQGGHIICPLHTELARHYKGGENKQLTMGSEVTIVYTVCHSQWLHNWLV